MKDSVVAVAVVVCGFFCSLRRRAPEQAIAGGRSACETSGPSATARPTTLKRSSRPLAASSDVYVPPGKYVLSGFELPRKVYLHGACAASTLIMNKDAGPVMVGSLCRVADLSLTGVEKYNPDKKSGRDQKKCLLHIRKQQDVSIDNIRVTDYKNTAVRVSNSKNVRITNSHFEKIDWANQHSPSPAAST